MKYIDPKKSQAYFQANYRLHVSTNGFYTFDCPICQGPLCRAVSFLGNYVKCFKGCTDPMDIPSFVAEVEGISLTEAEGVLWRLDISKVDLTLLGVNIEEKAAKSYDSGVTLPEGFKSLMSGEGLFARRARNSLRDRGFDLYALDRKGFGYVAVHAEDKTKDYFGYIIVPFRVEGTLVYYIGRAFLGQEPRYRNPPAEWVGVGKSDIIYNQDALKTQNKVYVLEGWSDAESIGPAAIATLGWSMSETQEALIIGSPCKKFVFIPDIGKDEENRHEFYKKAIKVALKFLEAGKRVKVIDLMPLLEHGTDVNEIGAHHVLRLEKETPELTWAMGIEILSNVA